MGGAPHKVIISTLWDQLVLNKAPTSGTDNAPSISSISNTRELAASSRSHRGDNDDDFISDRDSDFNSSHSVLDLKSLLSAEEDQQLGGAISAFPRISSSNDLRSSLHNNNSSSNNNNNSSSSSSSSNTCSHHSNQILTKSWNISQLTFNPCRSLVHDFHLIDYSSSEIISCMGDIARYFIIIFISLLHIACFF